MTSAPPQPASPLVGRQLAIGAITATVLGAVVGLVLGLRANPATVWFAIIEVAVPFALVGAAAGAIVGWLRLAFRQTTGRVPR